MEGINNKYIEEAINDLTDKIGIKEEVDHEKIVTLVKSGKVEECIERIAKQLKLPIKIKLSYVSDKYNSKSTDNFHSSDLVKTNQRNRGTESITAQVIIPSYLPMYGTPALEGFSIDVRISENCKKKPEAFMAIMAHELSHVVLHSIRHKEKENEIYTDITAMLLGFSSTMKTGREVVRCNSYIDSEGNLITKTQTTKYGYLSDIQFSFAYDKIISFLVKCRKRKSMLIDKINKLKNQIEKNKKTITCFKKYLEFIDKKIPKKMSQKDGLRISTFHRSGYTDTLMQLFKKSKSEVKEFENFIRSLNHYNDSSSHRIELYQKKVSSLLNNLNIEQSNLKSDVDVLKKYIPIIYRFRVFWNM